MFAKIEEVLGYSVEAMPASDSTSIRNTSTVIFMCLQMWTCVKRVLL